ncbi:hypothetical protein BKA69DRAFT_314180 [Paraphysoderma sedebokerense]|nr:hypothetical protein BKA69DRAFT_314180 [Paraphysoderma sedebokerense]
MAPTPPNQSIWQQLSNYISTIPTTVTTFVSGASNSLSHTPFFSFIPTHPISVVTCISLLYLLNARRHNTLFKRYKGAGYLIVVEESSGKGRGVGTKLEGLVTSVGDADGFRFWHRPTLLRWFLRTPPVHDRSLLSNETIAVRLAGVDAPEAAHFGSAPQPFSFESYEFLSKALIPGKPVKFAAKYKRGTDYDSTSTETDIEDDTRGINEVESGSPSKKRRKKRVAVAADDGKNDEIKWGRSVRIEILRKDQYGRVVAMVYYKPYSFIPFYYRNLSLEMLSKGLAVVYTQKGAVYGRWEDKFMRAEEKARSD